MSAEHSELFSQLSLAGAFDQLEVVDRAELVSDDEWEELSDFSSEDDESIGAHELAEVLANCTDKTGR